MPGRRFGKDHDAVATALGKGATLADALIAGGYSEVTARKSGRKLLETSAPLQDAIAKKAKNLESLGRAFSPTERANIARGKMLLNAFTGKDESAQSLKMIGQDREVNMFVPDQSMGIVNIVMPDLPECQPMTLPPEE
jgi:hypothetical protein